jgi:hypothetical protein
MRNKFLFLDKIQIEVIEIKTVSDFSELEGVRILQQQNLKTNLAMGEADAEGFLTAEYSIGFLQAMHEQSPSVIAKENDQVVGYALVALKAIGHMHPLLNDLFSAVDRTVYMGRCLKDSRYVLVGQLCVAKGYRGKGLVQKMYQAYRDILSKEFDYCITDVAEANPRSLKAHLKTGFKVIDTLTYAGVGWNIVLWDWRNRTGAQGNRQT